MNRRKSKWNVGHPCWVRFHAGLRAGGDGRLPADAGRLGNAGLLLHLGRKVRLMRITEMPARRNHFSHFFLWQLARSYAKMAVQ